MVASSSQGNIAFLVALDCIYNLPVFCWYAMKVPFHILSKLDENNVSDWEIPRTRKKYEFCYLHNTCTQQVMSIIQNKFLAS